MSTSDSFKRNKLDILDKVYHIAEDTLQFRDIDFEGDLIFVSRVTLRLIRHQKNMLNLAVE